MKLFVASTGRCGTTFMCNMLNRLTNLNVYHEPRPKFVRELMRKINNNEGPVTDEEFEIAYQEKISQIAGDIDENGNYAETSFAFIKSYVDIVLDNFDNDDIYCIYLHRNVIDTLMSYVLICRGRAVMNTCLQPRYKKNILKTTPGLDAFTTWIWHWFEVRERFYHYKDRFAKTWDFDFKNINDADEWLKMLNHFGIKVKSKYIDMKKLPQMPEDLSGNLTVQTKHFRYTCREPVRLELLGIKDDSAGAIMDYVMENWK